MFTIPKRIRRCAGPPSFRFAPSLLGELPRVAARVLTAFFAEVSGRPDLKPGIVSVIQTFNSDPESPPTPARHRRRAGAGREGAAIRFQRISITRHRDLRLIEEAFRREVLGLLRARDLLTEDDVEGMLAWPHSGFGVHNEVKVLPGDREGIIDLAKYLSRPPIALNRLSYDGEPVRLRLRRSHWLCLVVGESPAHRHWCPQAEPHRPLRPLDAQAAPTRTFSMSDMSAAKSASSVNRSVYAS